MLSSFIANLPNKQGSDYYIGIQASASSFSSASPEQIIIPGFRLSIYPNPEYNLWAQMGKWPGSQPEFSVGTGIQVSFPGENTQYGQTLGATWNKIFGTDYSQRDISIHGIYTRYSSPWDFGLMAIYTMHHVLVENAANFQDFDRTQLFLVPYFSWTFGDVMRLTASVPFNTQGAALSADIEWFVGQRE
ncbi:MAG: hypothetical protein K9N35_08835 [Candidatus Marinimicrobia bacterium]|nr:hypothetical protein [Candidatus Neomarinimicrobiota bacterium]